MTVELVDVPPGHRGALRRICTDAMMALNFGGPLRVRVVRSLPGAPPGIDASAAAHDDGVDLTSQLLLMDDMILRFNLFEEIGHVYLRSLSVGHSGPVNAFYQELFATWFALKDLRGHPYFGWGIMTTTPVPNDADRYLLAYDVGKHIAGALLGSVQNQRHLEDWFERGTTHRDLESMARWALQALAGITNTAQMADAVVDEWRRRS